MFQVDDQVTLFNDKGEPVLLSHVTEVYGEHANQVHIPGGVFDANTGEGIHLHDIGWRIKPTTPEHHERMNAIELAKKINWIDWDKVPYAKLREVAKLMELKI